MEFAKCKKTFKQGHPLLDENPHEWNNIPVCLVQAMAKVIDHIKNSDEMNLEYQLKTNERLYVLQH